MPAPDPATAFFWDGLKQGKLLILRCQECGHHVHRPRPICNVCQSTALAPAEVSGNATLYAFTVVVQPFHPYFLDKVPYIVAVVELVEEPGLRLTTNVVDVDPELLHVGDPVALTIREAAPGLPLPFFRPVPLRADAATGGRRADAGL